MTDMNWLAVVVAAMAAVALSTVYYMAFGKQMATLHPAYAEPQAAAPQPWKIGVEVVRSLVLAAVVACLAIGFGASNAADAVGLGLLLWIGFPVVLWTGAIVWEKVPPKLAAIHAGEWLLKLVLIALIVSLWR